MKCQNPFSFKPLQVTFWTTVTYLALFIPLIYVHEHVPAAPSDGTFYRGPDGINLTEAWQQLQKITEHFHPFNSHQNDDVRQYLIDQSKLILKRNKIAFSVDKCDGTPATPENQLDDAPAPQSELVTLFDDEIANVTKVLGKEGASYFEGTNFYIYIRGAEDSDGDWWNSESSHKRTHRKGGVLVNCHFDSVSTGKGATDDGIGCVSMLQLLSYFTIKGHQPRNGIVLLFNNVEEDGLLGAEAFGQSPLSQFAHTFVNLEGAGAGGRAILFRATDLEISQAYGKSPHPFGSVIAGDAFKRGAIKSRTDYGIFNDVYGMRGLDIAFYAPRSRYHTNEDDTRHTSVDSVWHMLSAALASTESLSQTTSTKFHGDRPDGDQDKVQSGRPTDGVWFDFVGRAWATFALRGLFAWSLSLLVAAPVVLLVLTYLLSRKDKYYFFAGDIKIHSELNEDPVRIGGWKGLLRFPITFIIATGTTFAFALLVAKVNPLIVYSSPYSIWAMSLSIFYFVFWLLLRGSSFVRPTALQRGFTLVWLFAIGWGVQVLAAVAEDRLKLGGFYFTVFLQTAIFVALFISLAELFVLPSKREFANQIHDAHIARDHAPPNHGEEDNRAASVSAEHQHDDEAGEQENEDETADATETTPLRAGEQGYGSNNQTTFASTYRQSVSLPSSEPSPKPRPQPYGHEQSWSGHLPNWTWFIQFIVLAPIPVLMIGNVGLLAMSALGNTGTDGGSLLVPILAIAAVSTVLLLPITPFIHRVTHHVPLFLLLVFMATLIYNLATFPFSVNNRFKFYFHQVVDLNDDTNTVSLSGLNPFIHNIVSSLPSTANQKLNCSPGGRGKNSHVCRYDASSLPLNLVSGVKVEDLLKVTVPESYDGSSVDVVVDAVDTRLCYLESSIPISGFTVEGAGPLQERFGGKIQDSGVKRIDLWRRDRSRPWKLNLKLKAKELSEEASEDEDPTADDRDELKLRAETNALADDSLVVTIRCAYSDANEPTTIPALTELHRYMPPWAAVTKFSAGLVEIQKNFTIQSAGGQE
ncbi:unnamed protein product [Clonostachys rosea f. rosea IK726]|uniref:Peptide hydrolase n=3 Tax=Bionectria ochroleuca TaxID=29856 RepID=A0A0B7JR69_BIOOC|nr:unnamed protein product [Clonostachys rosea f. rosea IK726]